MRRCRKRVVNLERRQLAHEIRGTMMVTFIQVALTVTLNALMAALPWV